MLRWLIFTLITLLLTACSLESGIKAIPILGDIYRLPDIDQRLGQIPLLNLLIYHRSMITHSALVPLTVGWLLRYQQRLGLILTGLFGSLFALHFLYDLFPQKWYGHAWVYIPVLGWLDWLPFDKHNWVPTSFSIFWLGLNLVLSLAACGLVLSARKA